MDDCPAVIEAIDQSPRMVVRYARLHIFGTTAVYSLHDIEETLNRVWNRYVGENDA